MNFRTISHLQIGGFGFFFGKSRFDVQSSVADPGFSPGGAPTPKSAIIFQFFAENCMKMKEFGPPGGTRVPGAPLGSANGHCTLHFTGILCSSCLLPPSPIQNTTRSMHLLSRGSSPHSVLGCFRLTTIQSDTRLWLRSKTATFKTAPIPANWFCEVIFCFSISIALSRHILLLSDVKLKFQIPTDVSGGSTIFRRGLIYFLA